MSEIGKKNVDRVIDEFFSTIERKGLKAIALSNEAEVRTMLLGLMECTQDFKLKIHKAIKDNQVEKVLMSSDQELTAKVVAELPATSEIIEIKEDE